MICPKCQDLMRTITRGAVHIEQCDNCKGVFLDGGELEQILAAERDHYAQAPPYAGTPQPAADGAPPPYPGTSEGAPPPYPGTSEGAPPAYPGTSEGAPPPYPGTSQPAAGSPPPYQPPPGTPPPGTPAPGYPQQYPPGYYGQAPHGHHRRRSFLEELLD
ncbi:zf-TFIIB domain-containing protein [Actinosynnema sp. NPDC047251]|uniref:TFIIB-type zinc ribbon-containing protein n=1 Tax=Saccharothrix espanaensis TaxID=103731 RepID=UPI000A2F1F6F|nr:zf-TFIIB domain-containing protein [Saccharothrix espanaensis]